MAGFAGARIDEGEEHVAQIFALKPSRISEALRLAVLQAENDPRPVLGAQEADRAIEHVREAAAWRRSAEGRISDLEARLQTEAGRADRAERRARVAEERLDQVLAVIASELGPSSVRN
jgi:hypothetical protein